MSTISLQGKNVKLPASLDTSAATTGAQLRSSVAKATNLNENRIRLTCSTSMEKTHVIANSDELANLATSGELKVTVKDLGPQLGWRTVYLIEYFGPIVAHLTLYLLPKPFYGQNVVHDATQAHFFYANIFHYLKREYETAFVHRFSLGTMPARNVFKNSFHYWILGGLVPAYCVYAPESWVKRFPFWFGREQFGWSSAQEACLWGLWAFCEWGNYNSHVILRNLRPSGSTTRAIPYGFGFDAVSCPNYFFESMGWFIQCLIVGNWSLWLFWFVGTVQMGIWALQKHKRYQKEFPDYPKQRKAFIPRVL